MAYCLAVRCGRVEERIRRFREYRDSLPLGDQRRTTVSHWIEEEEALFRDIPFGGPQGKEIVKSLFEWMEDELREQDPRTPHSTDVYTALEDNQITLEEALNLYPTQFFWTTRKYTFTKAHTNELVSVFTGDTFYVWG